MVRGGKEGDGGKEGRREGGEKGHWYSILVLCL